MYTCKFNKLLTSLSFSFSVHGSTYANCSDGDIKLVGGTTEYEGRVEICINSAWGTIARSSSNIAQTICNKLGYTIAGK